MYIPSCPCSEAKVWFNVFWELKFKVWISCVEKKKSVRKHLGKRPEDRLNMFKDLSLALFSAFLDNVILTPVCDGGHSPAGGGLLEASGRLGSLSLAPTGRSTYSILKAIDLRWKWSFLFFSSQSHLPTSWPGTPFFLECCYSAAGHVGLKVLSQWCLTFFELSDTFEIGWKLSTVSPEKETWLFTQIFTQNLQGSSGSHI